MFITKVFSFFFVCLLVACGKSASQPGESDWTSSTAEPNLFLRMERSRCMGGCPVYNLEIFQSGHVSFEEFGFSKEDLGGTKSKGRIENNLSEQKINQLIEEIDKAEFFSLRDNYKDLLDAGNCATDHPTVTLSIKLRGKEKKIEHNLGCFGNADLEKLTKLENKIDEIVGTKRWIGERK
jgi:hypothetical protein